MSHWMFNCKAVSQIVSESLDRKLPLHYRIMIRMHFLMCKYCTRFKDQLLTLRGACRLEDIYGEDLEHTDSLSPEACDRIKHSLSKIIGEHE
jgi:hypothetical protein